MKHNLLNRIISFLCSLLILTGSIQIPSSNLNVNALSAADAEAQIYHYLTNNMGYNDAVACGILANIECECNFNIVLKEVGNNVGYGIVQWSGGRRDDLKSWCKNNGYAHNTLEGQLRFMVHEMNNTKSYSVTAQTIKNAPADED